jgi:carbonic anhydrase/acetyltransferase-like protein (isoleucine patch superfamily)
MNPVSAGCGKPKGNLTLRRSSVMSKTNNIRPNLAGDYPQVHPSALIDPSAQIIGNVIIEKNVFIAPLAVIRADERGPDGSVAPIVIGEAVNIQDGVIVHSHGGATVTIGNRTSVAHGVAIHGPCAIGEDCFLAMRCVVYSATLANEVWVGMGALVMRAEIDPFTYISAGSVIRSRPDSWSLRLVSNKEKQYMKDVFEATNRLREDYLKSRAMVKVN